MSNCISPVNSAFALKIHDKGRTEIRKGYTAWVIDCAMTKKPMICPFCCEVYYVARNVERENSVGSRYEKISHRIDRRHDIRKGEIHVVSNVLAKKRFSKKRENPSHIKSRKNQEGLCRSALERLHTCCPSELAIYYSTPNTIKGYPSTRHISY